MKTAALSVILLGLLAGCRTEPPMPGAQSGDLLLAASLEGAVIAQSTIFPYHFVAGSADLNALGQRDLAVLARHLQGHAGTIVVRRGDASKDLANARVNAVLAALQSAGVPRDHVSVHDGLPGGDGLASARVIQILKAPLVLSGAGVNTSTGIATATTGSGDSTTNP